MGIFYGFLSWFLLLFLQKLKLILYLPSHFGFFCLLSQKFLESVYLTTVKYQLSVLQIIYVNYGKTVRVWHKHSSTVSHTTLPLGPLPLFCSKTEEKKKPHPGRCNLVSSKSIQVRCPRPNFEDQGCWEAQIHPTPQISESQKLLEFNAGSM